MDSLQINPQELSYEEFESLRCDKCKEYLNCPNIIVYYDSEGLQEPYTECGRCFGKTPHDENLVKPIRNIGAETLAAVTPFPCKYYENGCRERRIWPKIQLHEQECMFRILKCSLFKDNPSAHLRATDIIKRYYAEHPNLIIYDGILLLTFDKDFERPVLIQQNTDLFLCTVKYDLSTDIAKFTVDLFESRRNTECSIEFGDFKLHSTVTLKITQNSNEIAVDLKSIRTLLGDSCSIIKCKVCLNMRWLMHNSSDLLKEIQCPSCWDYMKGRILVCSGGHSVCSECAKSLVNCPICREEKVESIRNFSLEKVISQAFFPCKNHTEGCSYVCNLDEMISHQLYCRFNSDDEIFQNV